MKRYLLFTGYNYYPSGGIEDLQAQSDNIEELKITAKQNKTVKRHDWYQIVDSQHLGIVSSGQLRIDE